WSLVSTSVLPSPCAIAEPSAARRQAGKSQRDGGDSGAKTLPIGGHGSAGILPRTRRGPCSAIELQRDVEPVARSRVDRHLAELLVVRGEHAQRELTARQPEVVAIAAELQTRAHPAMWGSRRVSRDPADAARPEGTEIDAD